MNTLLVFTIIAAVACMHVYPPEPTYHDFPFPRIDRYNEIQNWPWPKYDMTQPPVVDAGEFKGLKVAIMAATGAEDVEVIYPYIFMAARGATVEIIGPDWQKDAGISLADWTKPTYVLPMTHTCTEAADMGLKYDVIIVAGGSWCSTVLRNSPKCVGLVKSALKSSTNAIVAPLCSGNEVMIPTGILGEHIEITGSGFSGDVLTLAGAKYMNQKVVVPTAYHGRLVSGQDPFAMFQWVQALRTSILTYHH